MASLRAAFLLPASLEIAHLSLLPPNLKGASPAFYSFVSSLPPAARNQAAAMSYLDEVPFRMARSLDGDSGGENTLVTAPDIELPDCADILMSTMVSPLCSRPRPDSLLVGCSKGCHQPLPFHVKEGKPLLLIDLLLIGWFAGVGGGEEGLWWVGVRNGVGLGLVYFKSCPSRRIGSFWDRRIKVQSLLWGCFLVWNRRYLIY